MRILFISTLGTGYRGGGNISSDLMAASLRDHGVEVVCEFIRKPQPKSILDRFLARIPEGFFNTQTPLLDLLIARRIRQHVREHRPDIVDIQDRFSLTAASRYDLGPVIKVFTVIDDLSRTQLEASFRSWRLFLLELKRRSALACLRREDFVLANSRHTREMLLEHGVPTERIAVIYHSLPPREWYSEAREGEAVAKRGGAPVVRFLMPGRIAREKGSVEVLECMAALNRDGLGGAYEVVMVGRGPLAAWAKETKGKRGLDNLRILPPVPIGEMYGYYRRADAVLMPTLCYESFGRVALESLLLGVPLIVNPRGGVKEVVEGLEGGCMFVRDREELEHAMRETLRHPRLLGEMSAFLEANAGRLRERFSHERLRAAYESYYRELIQGPPSCRR